MRQTCQSQKEVIRGTGGISKRCQKIIAREVEIVASVDLIKVFLLCLKIVMFTSMLISLNLTSALLKPSHEKAVLWLEG